MTRSGAAGKGLGIRSGRVAGTNSALRTICRFMSASSYRSGRAQALDIGRGTAQFGKQRVAVAAQRRHRIHARNEALLLAGGNNAGRRPAGLSMEVQRCRACNCGCAQTPAMSLTWALAICACSRRATTSAAGKAAKASTISARSSSRLAERLKFAEAFVVGQFRAAQDLVAEGPATRARSAGRASPCRRRRRGMAHR